MRLFAPACELSDNQPRGFRRNVARAIVERAESRTVLRVCKACIVVDSGDACDSKFRSPRSWANERGQFSATADASDEVEYDRLMRQGRLPNGFGVRIDPAVRSYSGGQ